MISASIKITAEMLQATTAPIRPKVGPKTAISAIRTNSTAAMMRG